MLFKQKFMTGIKDGTITLAFRKWKKPAVKKGSLLKTAVGRVEILEVGEVYQDQIGVKDAEKAGYRTLEELKESLAERAEGRIYKIRLRYHSPDPRIALREKATLTDGEFEAINQKLERLDQYSRQGFWTFDILTLIRDNPHCKAADLAAMTGREKDWLKINIRKLKNLGLTVSHNPGYTLSARGKAFLERL